MNVCSSRELWSRFRPLVTDDEKVELGIFNLRSLIGKKNLELFESEKLAADIFDRKVIRDLRLDEKKQQFEDEEGEELREDGNSIDRTIVDEEDENFSFIYKRYRETATKSTGDSKSLIKQHKHVIVTMAWLKDQIIKIKSAIQMNLPFHNKCTECEYICLIVNNTLLNDRWYSNGEKTGNRPPFQNMPVLIFSLSMYFRAWRRRNLILKIPDDNLPPEKIPPLFRTTADFQNRWFRTPEGLENSTIAEWSPERTYLAMISLSKERLMDGRMQLSSDESMNVFMDYRDALLDRVAQIAISASNGPKEKLVTHELNWFKNSKELSTVSVSEAINQSILLRNADTSTLKQVQKLRKEQDDEVAKEFADEIVTNDPNQCISILSVKQKLDLLKTPRMQQEVDKIKRELDNLKVRKELIIESLEASKEENMYKEENSEDESLMKKLNDEIKITEEYLETLTKDIKEADIKEHNERAKLYQRLVEQRNKFISASEKKLVKNAQGTSISIETFVPIKNYFRDNMLLAYHIQSMHKLPQTDTKHIKSKLHFDIKSVIFEQIIDTLKKTDTSQAAHVAEIWIVGRKVQFWERERYRQGMAVRTAFKALDAWKYSRDDIEDTSPWEDFGEDISKLLDAKSRYFYDATMYCVHFWLQQSYTSVEIDNLFFYWELEKEYLCVDRPQILTPVMSLIGSNWCIFHGGNIWDNEEGWIDVQNYGPEILDCLAEFIIYLYFNDWKLMYRRGGEMCNFTKTALDILMQPILDKHKDELSARYREYRQILEKRKEKEEEEQEEED